MNHMPKSSVTKTPSVCILLVEDNPISGKVQARMLNTKGFSVSHVDNGYDAIQHIKKMTYAAVIMDLNMPILNGYETTELIRAWEKQQELQSMPIIALTASAAPEPQEYNAKGIDYYIEKPLDDTGIAYIVDIIEQSKSCSMGKT